MNTDRRVILAAAAPWLAALLNVVPGLGTGYIYQRRWRAYWITSALATGWFLLGLVLAPPPEGGGGLAASGGQRDQLIGLAGLLLLAVVTAVEAALSGRRARQADGAS